MCFLLGGREDIERYCINLYSDILTNLEFCTRVMFLGACRTITCFLRAFLSRFPGYD